MLDSHEKQYHIAVAAGEIGEYCILPGDPGRCAKIAAFLEDPVHVNTNREYEIWNGRLGDKRVTVCSTGIGGPSTAIAVEELAACGAKVLIRVGTCGGIALDVNFNKSFGNQKISLSCNPIDDAFTATWQGSYFFHGAEF